MAFNILAWAAAIPILAVIGSSLFQRSKSGSDKLNSLIFYSIEVLLVVWAALIYWRCVPGTQSLPRRAIYFCAFAALMIFMSYAGLGAAWVAVSMIFGA